MKDIRLRDLPSFVRATDPNDCLFNLCLECAERASEGPFLTFDASEQEKSFTLCFLMRAYKMGSLLLLLNEMQEDDLNSIGCNLWKEEAECLQLMAGIQDAQLSNLCEFWHLSGRYKAAAH